MTRAHRHEDIDPDELQRILSLAACSLVTGTCGAFAEGLALHAALADRRPQRFRTSWIRTGLRRVGAIFTAPRAEP